MADNRKNTGRLAFIDWTRGLAAVIMIQGHVFDSFTRGDLRTQSPFVLSQFLGGMPPAIFLFLTGITFAFLMDSEERKGGKGWQRLIGALKRSRYLFLIAFLFRIQLYVFGYPDSPANELLKVDILNCMGFAMLVMAPMAVFTTRERIRLCTVLGVVIAGLSPVISMIDPNSVPSLVRAYLFPSYNYFGFFPWASFLAFGMVAGSIIRIVKPDDLGRAMLWFLTLGVGLALLAHQFSNLPYSIYPKSEFWLNSPGLVFIKLGVVMAMLAIGWLWISASDFSRWSLFRQLGTTSLIVYWVHIELVYGRWLGVWKEGLNVPQVLLVTAFVLVLMVGVSVGQSRLKQIVGWFKPAPAPQPRRASGD